MKKIFFVLFKTNPDFDVVNAIIKKRELFNTFQTIMAEAQVEEVAELLEGSSLGQKKKKKMQEQTRSPFLPERTSYGQRILVG